MPISKQEPTEQTCPSCGCAFASDQWILIDGGEHPELRDALIAGSLNSATCPTCHMAFQANSALLLHEPELQRVYFAVPYEAEEHAWRTQAQELLYALVAELPEEARLPYLGDVQIEWGIDGIQRALTRKSRRGPRERRQAAAAPVEPTQAPVVSGAASDLLDRVQEVLAVENPEEFRLLVQKYPELRGIAADALLESLAREARQNSQPDVTLAIQQVRTMLRQSGQDDPHVPASIKEPSGELPAAEIVIRSDILSDAAYQSFLAAATVEELQDAARDHPALLEPWTDALLLARSEAALDAGHERLAAQISQHSEFLHTLRTELTKQVLLQQAIQQLLVAQSEEPIAQVLAEFPVLLTQATQDVLAEQIASAQAASDAQRAKKLVQCRSMLRTVRHGMDVG